MNSRHILRKKAVVCLLGILCLSCLTPYAEAKMNLEELVQRLDAAEPWSVEKVEKVLESKLVKIDSTKTFSVYTAGSFQYEEGLIIEEVHLRLLNTTNGLIRLIVSLSDEASCFTLDRIKKTYPDIQHNPYGLSTGGKFGYWTERPWGHISFSFNIRRPDCLSGITFIPKGEDSLMSQERL